MALARWDSAGSATERDDARDRGLVEDGVHALAPPGGPSSASAQSPSHHLDVGRHRAQVVAACPKRSCRGRARDGPWRTSASARWLPMNPAPPVTRIFIGADFITERRWIRKEMSAEWVCKPDPVPAPPFRTRRAAIIPLAPRLPAGSSDLPGGFGRASLERPPIWSCSVWGFPCPPCHHAGGALLPHLFTLATPALRPEFGGVFSVALSLRSPSLAVSQHTALGVRTFLPGHDVGRGDRPTHSTDLIA